MLGRGPLFDHLSPSKLLGYWISNELPCRMTFHMCCSQLVPGEISLSLGTPLGKAPWKLAPGLSAFTLGTSSFCWFCSVIRCSQENNGLLSFMSPCRQARNLRAFGSPNTRPLHPQILSSPWEFLLAPQCSVFLDDPWGKDGSGGIPSLQIVSHNYQLVLLASHPSRAWLCCHVFSFFTIECRESLPKKREAALCLWL